MKGMDTKMKTLYTVLPEKIGRIAPEIYGHFSEHIGGVFYDGLYVGKDSKIPNIKGFRKDIIEKLREINIPVLRWPGGCYAETYNWRDGIGENRPVRPSWWTLNDGRYEPNTIGTHEFVELCELIGAKPYFAMNVTSITPLDARDWMDYCLSPKGSTTLALEREKNGHPEPFDIPYWGVGNENWGGGGNMTPEYYAGEYRKFATVMHNTVPRGKHVDLIAGGANGGDTNWTNKLAENVNFADYTLGGMSFHYYCGNAGDPVNFTEDEWYRQLRQADVMEELIVRHYGALLGHRKEDKMKLVIDEWGCWHPDGSGPSRGYNLFEQQSTVRDAMVSAITLNIFNNHCEKIKMANVAQICNNLHALFLAGGENCIVTPTYHVFKMFKEHMGGEAVRTLCAKDGGISSSASIKDGYLTLTLANRSCTEDAEISLEMLGGKVESTASALLLAEDDMHAHNTFENPENVKIKEISLDISKPITLPKAAIISVRAKLA